jgi:hypothetical protein
MYKIFAIIAGLLFVAAISLGILGNIILFSIYGCTSLIILGIAFILIEIEKN